MEIVSSILAQDGRDDLVELLKKCDTRPLFYFLDKYTSTNEDRQLYHDYLIPMLSLKIMKDFDALSRFNSVYNISRSKLLESIKTGIFDDTILIEISQLLVEGLYLDEVDRIHTYYMSWFQEVSDLYSDGEEEKEEGSFDS